MPVDINKTTSIVPEVGGPPAAVGIDNVDL
jgi:hypothetical protein